MFFFWLRTQSRSSACYSLDLLVAVLLVVVVAIISVSIITSIIISSSSIIIISIIVLFVVAVVVVVVVVVVVDVNVTARPRCTADVTTTGCTGVYICDDNRGVQL